MKRKPVRFSVSVAGSLLLLELLATGVLCSQDGPVVANGPISLRYVQAGEPGHVRSVGTTFLVTNHTSNTVVANFSAIEIKAGTNWVTQMSPHGPLLFSAPGSVRIPGSTNAFTPGLTTTELQPHQAAYSTIQFSGQSIVPGPTPGSRVGNGMNYLSGQPTGTVWRLRLSVQEKLGGLADVSARIRSYPDLMQRRAAGNTNLPMNPFSGAYSFYGKPFRVVSPEDPSD